MNSQSYVGRIYKTFTANNATAQPVFTITLPNYACEVRFKIEGSTKNTFAYSFDPKYNVPELIPNEIMFDNTFYTISPDSTRSGIGGTQCTQEIVWRHAEGMPNALFIICTTAASANQQILSYSIIGGKNNGY